MNNRNNSEDNSFLLYIPVSSKNVDNANTNMVIVSKPDVNIIINRSVNIIVIVKMDK